MSTFSEQRFGDCKPDFVIETDTQYIIADVENFKWKPIPLETNL